MSEQIDRSAALIERLLGEPELRRRFLADPAGVLSEHGLSDLASDLGHGQRALMTLELRESRSSLAGVMVAAAAEAVDLAHVVERATPGMLHDAVHAVQSAGSSGGAHPHHAGAAHPASAGPAASAAGPATTAPAAAGLNPLAQPAPASHPAAAPAPAAPAAQGASATPAAPAAQTGPPGGTGSSGAGGATTPAGGVGEHARLGSRLRAQAGAPAAAPAATSTPAAGGRAAPSAPAPTAVPAPTSAAPPAATPAPGASPSGGQALPTDPPVHHHAHGHHDKPAVGVLDTPPAQHPDPLAYPGDSATPQQFAAWMGAHAAKAGLPAELPVMAALTESGLRNLNYGDRDSVGFFQMRLGIWNEGPYVGYPSNPQLQIQWFIDHALAVKAQYPGLAQNPATWGELVANVEQPAAEYRYRYQLQLATAQALLHGADLTPAPPAPPVPLGQAALKVALTQLQTTGGGEPRATGFDGAGLVQFAFAHEGVGLPRLAAEQFDVGMPVGRDQLKLGDAVFFKDGTGFVHQVGLYVGSGRFITAPDQTGHVRISALSDPQFAATYAGARRFTLGALGDPKSYARSMPTVGS